MFILHSSNKTENLLTHLTTVLENMPLSCPLATETFLIQSQGMERWLSQQLASHFGIWANYQFLFPSKFFSSLATKIDTKINNSLFDRDLMLWQFDLLLRDISQHTNQPIYAPLHHYLSGENKPLKRYQLATQLASVFDQYQMMRPDMLESWRQGKLLYHSDNERWQCGLWQNIIQVMGYKHRGSLWQAVIDKLNDSQAGVYTACFPERIFVFGLNTMPPLFLDYLQGLSRHCAVHLFLLNPAQDYWADLVTKKQAKDDGVAGHSLLSVLGQQGREFQQMLLEQAQFTYQPESYQPTNISNNLQKLQNDILDNQTGGSPLRRDNSISIHSCYSRIREVEVLKDQLLEALEDDPKLELRDIIVMAPDIQQYTPFIAAVFSDIQHTIADHSLRFSNAMLDGYIRFLKLTQSRFGWQNVMDLLEQPMVLQKFSISNADLTLIRHWVLETHVRWGKSAEHKKQLGLPALSQNTWQSTLERLFMGYAVGNDTHFVDNILPYPIEDEQALVLGRFDDFMQLLFKASDTFKQATTLSCWSHRLYDYAQQLMLATTETEQNQQQQLYELLQQLTKATQIHNKSVRFEVILTWLESKTVTQKSVNGFLRGQLTFCAMLPMRSIPFKVIALLGLNEGEFPKIDRYPSFDLINQHFRRGDRCLRTDNRYQFLEIILSARKQLIITYIGQSIYRHTDIPPSVIISELLDVLENDYQLTNLISKHPLQAFSTRYFNCQTESLFSFSQPHCETAISLQNSPPKATHWWQGKLKTKPTTNLDIDDLLSFYRHPQQHFFQQQFGMRLNTVSAPAEEREFFAIDPLNAYIIKQQWLASRLANQQFSAKKLQAQGRWLSGVGSAFIFEQYQQTIEQFVTCINQQNLGDKQPDCAIDCRIGDYQLLGNITHIYTHGSLIYRCSKLKGKDFMQAWLHHLLLNQIRPHKTHLLTEDKCLIFTAEIASSSHLQQLLAIFLQGLQQPNAFWTETAFAYIKQASKSSNRKQQPIVTAQEMLLKEIDYDATMRQLYQNIDDVTEVLNTDFETQCRDLILPIWKAVQ